MSDYQPKKPQLGPGRSRYVTRRILESWPLLVWLFMLAVVIYGYKRGVEFKRMNGAVDVYQEAIAAADDGRIQEILVQPGDQLEVGQVVARMDPTFIDKQIQKLERQIKAERQERIRDYRKDVLDLQKDIREIRVEQDEYEAKIEMIKEAEALYAGTSDPARQNAIALQRIRREKLQERLNDVDGEITALEIQLKQTSDLLNNLIENPELTDGADGTDLVELEILLEQKANLELKTSVSGGVYRVEKEPGEYVRAAETVVRIVAAPQYIVGFLPENQQDQLNVGDTVWVSSTVDRHTSFPTTVLSISPRISTTADTTSPLPNKVIRGREVTMDLPEGIDLLPGQTLIIHVNEPGSLPLIDKLLQFR